MDKGTVVATGRATEMAEARVGGVATGGRAAQGEEEAGLPEPATGVYLAEKEVTLFTILFAGVKALDTWSLPARCPLLRRSRERPPSRGPAGRVLPQSACSLQSGAPE